MSLRESLVRIGASLARAAVRQGEREVRRRGRARGAGPAARPGVPRTRHAPTPGREPNRAGRPSGPYLGDFTGSATLSYAPHADGRADPGEIVWTWVPYEEDHGQGKDRPVLVIGRAGGHLLALMLTSKDHDRDAADEARHGRRWMDVGAGVWDRQHRPSEVRLDRVLQIRSGDVRREGAQLDRARFDQVADQVRALHHWPA